MKLRVIYILTLLISIISGGCSVDSDDVQARNDKQIVLQIEPIVPSYVASTKATEAGTAALNENLITKLHIFIYPNGSSGSTPSYYYENVSGLNVQGTSVSNQLLSVPPANFTFGLQYDIYVIANLPSDVAVSSAITIDQLKALSTLTPLDAAATQTSFVMDCKTTAVLNTGSLSIQVPIALKRAASKIRLNVVFPSGSPMASAPTCYAQFKNFVKKGSIIDAIPYTVTSGDYNNTAIQTKPSTQSFVFYSYQNNWGSNSANEPYIVLNIPNFGVQNYYRIGVNPYTDLNTDGQGAGAVNNSGKLQRNVLYDVTTYIDKLGSNSENGAVSLTGNYTRTDWSTGGNIDVTIANNHWLIVNEYNITMNNTSCYSVGFTTDILPVSVINLTATYKTYSNAGVESTVSYVSGTAQFPTVTVNNSTMQINISSAVPTNYGPKIIKFQVTNGSKTSGVVTVIQYPVTYVTARVSTGNLAPDWANHGSVNTLYTVTTTAPGAGYNLSDPTNGGLLTDSTASGASKLSPKFVLASEWGASSKINYVKARTRCTKFAEDVYRSGWRMPTKAELDMLRRIQVASGSVVTSFMQKNSPYWSAFQYQNFSFTTGLWTNVNATTSAYIRCVYDVYKL